jgi:hypothetical protein
MPDQNAAKPNLTFTAPRTPLDSTPPDPAAPAAGAVVTGDANLTPHINDPAMRRAPPPADGGNQAVGGSHSDLSPLAKVFSAPVDEETRHRLNAEAADLRARHHDLPPRGDVEAWQEDQVRNHT